nr:tail fiber domain-containing protein [Pantoea vagans]
MTVSTVVNHEQYTGNGVTTVFPYRFRILKSAHMVVTVSDTAGVIRTLIAGTDYTITGVGLVAGGNVVLSSALADGWLISLDRDLPAVQETDLRNQGRFFAETHEDAFDYLTMLIQRALSVFGLALQKPSWIARYYDAQGNRIINLGTPSEGTDAVNKTYVDTLSTNNLNHTLRVPEAFVAEVPSVAQRANRVLGFNQEGNPVAVVPGTGDASQVMLDLASTADGKGDSLIGVLQPLTGSTPRTQHQKNTEIISVLDFGAKGDGVSDESAAFAAAVKAVTAKDISPSVYLPVPHSQYCEVLVPAGTYLLSSLVDVGGRTVTWVADAGASFINPANLNGRIFRQGIRNNNVMQHGTLDGACSFSVSANRGAEACAQVLGVTSPDQIATYTDRDSVGFYAENYAPQILATTSAGTYTVNSVTLGAALTADQVKKMRVGMIVDTKHTPTKYSGIVTGWAANGTSIAVEGWYLVDGSSATHSKVTPANGPGVNINPFTKTWAMNANVFIDANSHAAAAVGMELGVANDKFDYDPATDTWHTWCYDAITLGSKRCETAYMQRGYYYKGYESRGATGYGFTGKNAGTIWPSMAMYHSQANSDFQFIVQPDLYNNKTSFAVKKEGNVEMGRTDAAQTTILDFHSSGNDIDYDARISVQGGTATIGQGNVTFAGGQFFWSVGYAMDASMFRPTTDSGRNLGSANYRFNTVFASTGTINTSDVTTKTFLDIDQAEKLAASEIKGMMRKFQFNDAISEKGSDKARYHFGVGAQYVRDVLIKHGLEPDMYAFLCYDKWEDEYEDIYEDIEVEREVAGKVDEPIIINGEQVGVRSVDITYIAKVTEQRATGEKRLVRKAGELYGIRYDELICFIISSL